MASSVSAIYRGIDYQATLAWIYICTMLRSHSHVEKIVYESNDVKSFDDIVVYYKPSAPRVSESTHRSILFDYYQVKFHLTYDGVVSFDNLMDPAFISATKDSILIKLANAVQKLGGKANLSRFTLTTPWNIDPQDLLAKVVSTNCDELIIEKLFKGKTNRSETYRMREKLMQHMGISSSEGLRKVLSLFRIQSSARTEQQLIEDLNYCLCNLNLVPINGLLNPYSHLVQKWTAHGSVELTRDFVLKSCKQEGLLVPKASVNRIPVGIRSFRRGTENMQDVTESMLCLLPDFDGRSLKQGLCWDTDIKPKVDSYFASSLSHDKSYMIHLETHYAIAFAAGRALDSKSGINIAPVQKTLNKPSEIWEIKDSGDTKYNDWIISTVNGDKTYHDIVVVFSATHRIIDEVAAFVSQQGLNTCEIVHFCLSPDTHHRSINDGAHAYFLAQSASKTIYEKTRIYKSNKIYLFMAVPISLCFFLGQVSLCWGTCTIFEYDMEKDQTYVPTITL